MGPITVLETINYFSQWDSVAKSSDNGSNKSPGDLGSCMFFDVHWLLQQNIIYAFMKNTNSDTCVYAILLQLATQNT